ncbi:MAG: HAD-IB family hydrolase [Flavisolibacter sp.]
MKKGLALFDFDGTITSKDTLIEFIKFNVGDLEFYKGFLYNFYYLAAFKLKIISNQRMKEKIIKFFFQNTPIEQFDRACFEFTNQVLNRLIRKKAIREINTLKERGFEIVIVSASPENWILYWAEQNGLGLIATRLAVSKGMLTGRIVGKNCYGIEKLRRIEEKYTLSDYKEIYAYGDSSGDPAMLNAATKAFYQPFQES